MAPQTVPRQRYHHAGSTEPGMIATSGGAISHLPPDFFPSSVNDRKDHHWTPRKLAPARFSPPNWQARIAVVMVLRGEADPGFQISE
jgi:hypothetical protein